jgi:hypothetical protein
MAIGSIQDLRPVTPGAVVGPYDVMVQIQSPAAGTFALTLQVMCIEIGDAPEAARQALLALGAELTQAFAQPDSLN